MLYSLNGARHWPNPYGLCSKLSILVNRLKTRDLEAASTLVSPGGTWKKENGFAILRNLHRYRNCSAGGYIRLHRPEGSVSNRSLRLLDWQAKGTRDQR